MTISPAAKFPEKALKKDEKELFRCFKKIDKEKYLEPGFDSWEEHERRRNGPKDNRSPTNTDGV